MPKEAQIVPFLDNLQPADLQRISFSLTLSAFKRRFEQAAIGKLTDTTIYDSNCNGDEFQWFKTNYNASEAVYFDAYSKFLEEYQVSNTPYETYDVPGRTGITESYYKTEEPNVVIVMIDEDIPAGDGLVISHQICKAVYLPTFLGDKIQGKKHFEILKILS